MRTRSMVLVSITVLSLLFFVASPGAMAASKGELRIAVNYIGYQVPLPRLESTHGLDWLKFLYDGLVGSTPDGQLSTEMGLAEKWEMSADATTWTFHIRKGIKFHDGVEVTAKDTKFSIEQTMRKDSRVTYGKVIRKTVKSIEVKDKYTMVVKCKKPYIYIAGLFSDLYTDGYVQPKDSYEKVGEKAFVNNPIGTGPYRFHTQMVGSHIKMEATDRHWRDGVPKYKYVTFRIIPEESASIAMLRTGEADITRISRERIKEVKDAGLNLVVKENAAVVMFNANMQWTSKAFSDIRFRKALNLAIDKESIIKHIFVGMAKPFVTYPGSNSYTCKKPVQGGCTGKVN